MITRVTVVEKKGRGVGREGGGVVYNEMCKAYLMLGGSGCMTPRKSLKFRSLLVHSQVDLHGL